MPKFDCAQLADSLLTAVLHAGRVQLAHRRAGTVATRKADGSPVTAADQDSEEIILAAITRVLPGVAVIAEEAASRGEIPPPAREFWLVDPLDGTREYVAGGDDFTVNVALIVDRAPVFGIVYAPAMGQLYVTAAPDRAIEATVTPESPAQRMRELRVVPIRTREPDSSVLVAIASRSHGVGETDSFLARLGIGTRIRIGSSLKFCRLARGDADIYPRFGAINEWDTAAGHAVLAAAGGCVTVADGRDLAYGKAAAHYLNPPFIAWGRRSLVRAF